MFFLIHVYLGSKFCFLKIQCMKNFYAFNLSSSSKSCSPTECASAFIVVCRDADIFETKTLFLKHVS